MCQRAYAWVSIWNWLVPYNKFINKKGIARIISPYVMFFDARAGHAYGTSTANVDSRHTA